MQFRMLGPLEVVVADGGALSLGSAQQRAVLALLLIRAPEPVSRDRLIDELWAERPTATAVHAVQVHVSAIRKILRADEGEPTLRASRAGYVLAVDPERIDAKRFERLLSGAQQCLREDPAHARELFQQALGLWRGAPLADLAQFDFAAREADRLEELHADAVEGVVHARLALGQHAEVLGQITSLVTANPLREGPRRLLMLALYRSGRHAEALAAYGDARTALDEIGLEPSPQLRQLQEAILRHDPSLGATQGAADAAEVNAEASRSAGLSLSPPSSLLGRESEKALLDGLLAQARSGISHTLVIRGDAGIGKTALLDYAAGRAVSAGMRLIRAEGAEPDVELAFAGLLEVCRPLMRFVGSVEPRQASALRDTLSFGSGEGADRFLINAATLSLIAAAADERPLLIAIDDAQWLDAPSADALVFAARRLEADPVAVVFAARSGEQRGFEAHGVEALTLHGLDTASATTFLERRANRAVPPHVVSQLVDFTGGNPLALISLDVAPEQLTGAEPLSTSDLRLSNRIEDAFARRASGLPEETRWALLVAAASSSDESSRIIAALVALELEPDVLEPAEDDGLLSIREGRILFLHPLVRSSLLHGAVPSQRRRAHRALAEAFPDDVARRAWHLSEASQAPDEAVATLLEEAAGQALTKGGYAASATNFERAARLTPDLAVRARRLYAAADTAWRAGWADRCERLLDEALALSTGAARLRAAIQHLRAHAMIERGATEEARNLLTDEAARVLELDPAQAAYMLGEATEASIFRADYETALHTSEQAVAAAISDGGIGELIVRLSRGATLTCVGRLDEGLGEMRACVDLYKQSEDLRSDPRSATWVLNAYCWLDDYSLALQKAREAVELGRLRGATGDMAYSLQYLADLEYVAGEWTRARATVAEAISVARATRANNQLAWSLALSAQLAAALGDQVTARRDAAEAFVLTETLGILREYPAAALGLLELGRGNPEGVIAILTPHVRLGLGQGQHAPLMSPFDLIEAEVRSGRRKAARESLEQIQHGYAGRGWERAGIARGQAFVAGKRAFAAHFEESIHEFQALPMPFEVARSQMYYGERLRETGSVEKAADQLEAALTTFEEIGADVWSARTRRELRAAGRSVRRLPRPALGAITAEELQVALQLSQDKSLPEIAAALFITPRAVEARLDSGSKKLGVKTRTELIGLFTSQTRSRA